MFQTRSSWRTLLIAGIVIASLPLVTMAIEAPRIRLVEKAAEQPAAFEVTEFSPPLLSLLQKLEPNDPTFARLLSVSVVDKESKATLPPMSGSYRLAEKRLLFVPRFPLQPGLTYRVILSTNGIEPDPHTLRVSTEITIPKPDEDKPRPPTQVRHIFPTSDILPENHLRFYIEFTQPMARSAAYENLELLNEQGEVVEAAFLELGEELWDPANQRFTLLLDPGRIKRGLKPREEDGPILEAGKKYTLVVKRSWLDGRGRMLKSDFRKTFTAGPAYEKPLDIAEWKLEAPSSGTRSLLTVRFPRPLDHALLNRLLTVTDRNGHPIQGQHIVCDSEKRWTFAPDEKWHTGSYNLVVDTVLEDSAGNRIGRAFEVDQVEDVTDKLHAEYVKIPFEVLPKETTAIKQ